MASMLPPTCHLPPMRHVGSYPTNDLLKALTYLRHLYIPEVRGSRRRRPESGPRQSPSLEEGLDELRSDAFEQSYAIKWLTALISQAERWSSDAGTDADSQARESLIQTAAALLAVCSGTAAAGVIIRDFIFTPHPPAPPSSIKVHIRDVPLDNRDYGSVGAQTWGGACVLAEMIVDDPSAFNLLRANAPVRVLELGAGTGLVSITIAKLLLTSPTPSLPATDIVATDYYPSVLANLSHNILSNFPSSPPSASISLSSHPLDWSLFSSLPTPAPELSTPFDLILGADIIYEPDHALWIKSCLQRLLRKPNSASGSNIPIFHLVIPLRSTHSSESLTVETIFGTTKTDADTSNLDLGIISRETIICDARDGSSQDQVEYAYYRIGWC